MKKGVLLAVVTGTPSDVDVLEAALALSHLYDSHIEVLHPRLDPYRVLAGFIDGINGLGTSDIVAGIRLDIDRRQQVARGAFNAWTAQHGIRQGNEIGKNGAGRGESATSSWRQYEGTYEGAMMQIGRLVDFIVVAQPGPGGRAWQDSVVEAAIFNTGRPVLCVPAGTRNLDSKSVAIMWNGSLEAARAVGAAMPLLSACGSVTVVTAGRSEGADPTDLVERLVVRGIEARTKRIHPAQELTPSALHALIVEGKYGLVVMGGYGHSRLRELVLGGLTRHMLAEAKVPILLAH
ncbi:universal stress protein [Dongia sp.]|uniref:universal stress protein n=1 Tax=Dongia sp. TaxID=1977262 RepID=UPI0035B1CF78